MNSKKYPFELENLNFSYDAFEPFIDSKTMEIHHTKHLQIYITNLNNILKQYPSLQEDTLSTLPLRIKMLRGKMKIAKLRNEEIKYSDEILEALENNLGGVLNHRHYFRTLIPNGKPPSAEFLALMERNDYTFDTLKQKIKEMGMRVFGSGYAVLIRDFNGDLNIMGLSNQDSARFHQQWPLLTLDVWEHAYYLKNLNNRSQYIDNWFNIVNWEQVEKNYTSIESFQGDFQVEFEEVLKKVGI